MTIKLPLLAAFAFTLVVGDATAQESVKTPAAFAAPPKAEKSGDGTKIRFAVSAGTDAEVAVLDAQGKIVRHLGGGALGENSPEPFQKGLAQEIVWDGKDDSGKPASGGPFKARVALGLKAEFDRIIGWSGQEVENLRGLACGTDGTLYVIYGGCLLAHRETTLISAFDRDGKYLRQILPGPGGLPPEKRKGWPQVKPATGGEVPVVWHMLTRAVNPSVIFSDANYPTVTPDGRFLAVSGFNFGIAEVTEPDYHDGRRLLILGTDGSVPENYLGPVVAGEKETGPGFVAVAPDGKHAYICGVNAVGTIWQADLSGQTPAAPLTIQDAPKNPSGLAVDKAGNLYVSDPGKNRIVVLRPDGTLLKEVPAKDPGQVLVSRKNGVIYAVVETDKRVVKLGGLDDPSEKASFSISDKMNPKGKVRTLLALDDSAAANVLWLATRNWTGGNLHRLTDTGERFQDAGDPISGKTPAMNFTSSAAEFNGKLFTRVPELKMNYNAKPLVFDAQSGAFDRILKDKIPLNGNSLEFTAGKDGKLYTQSNGWPKEGLICRFGASMEPLPFSDGQTIASFHGHTHTAGIFVNRAGDIYVPGGSAYRAINPGAVRVFGPDGKQKGDPVLNIGGAFFGGIAVDSRGNIYLGAQVVEKEQILPSWFVGRLPASTQHGYPLNAYRHCGAVIKFKPSGGAIVPDPAGGYIGAAAYKRCFVALKNAEWLRRGGEVPARDGGSDGVHCFCETTRFGIDDYDRLFVPDVYRFCVEVLDAAGNTILRIGSYGNMDNRGPKSAFPEPAIPYGWPLVTQVDGDQLYVLDEDNRRVVVVRLTHDASEACDVR